MMWSKGNLINNKAIPHHGPQGQNFGEAVGYCKWTTSSVISLIQDDSFLGSLVKKTVILKEKNPKKKLSKPYVLKFHMLPCIFIRKKNRISLKKRPKKKQIKKRQRPLQFSTLLSTISIITIISRKLILATFT